MPKQKSARAQRPADSRFGFAKPVFQPHAAALPTVPVIQAKLKIGEPNDKFEEEADRVAGEVMRVPEPQLQRACPCGRGCPKCQTGQPGQEHKRLQPKRLQLGNLGQTAVLPIVHEVLASPGQPLDAATRAFMEPRFGHDFSQVRVHADTKAAESAGVVNALAYTVGSHIVLGKGQPSTETIAGRRLLAHELAHVVQQSRGGPAPDVTPSAPHEQDAHAAAMAVAIGLPSVRIACQTGLGIARQPEMIPDLQAELEGLKGVALGLLAEEGIPPPVARQSVGKPLRIPSPRINDVVRQLRRVADDPGSPRAARARELLSDIEERRGVIRELELEREAERGPGPSRREQQSAGERPRTRRGGPPPRAEFITGEAVPLKPPAKTVGGGITVPDKPGVIPSTPAPPPQQGTSQLPKGPIPAGGKSTRVPSPGMPGTVAGAALLPFVVFGKFYLMKRLQEQFAPSIAKEAREMISKAIEGHREKFNALIESRSKEIQKTWAEGRQVMLHVVVNTEWVQTNIGRVLTLAEVVNFKLIFDGVPTVIQWPLWEKGRGSLSHLSNRPRVWLGLETFDIVLEGMVTETPAPFKQTLASPRSLKESLDLDPEQTKDWQLEEEIELIEEWLDTNPFNPERDQLRTELKRLQAEEWRRKKALWELP